MAKYKILIKPSAVKELNKLPAKEVQRIANKIQTLATNQRPPGCEKLSTLEKYRMRQGNYRIVYEIDDEKLTVTAVKIGHRREVYR